MVNVLVLTTNKKFLNLVQQSTTANIEHATTAEYAMLKVKEANILVLDGETAKNGAMSFNKQLQEEVDSPPPAIIFVKRKEDKWISKWSGAKKTLCLPVNPIELGKEIRYII